MQCFPNHPIAIQSSEGYNIVEKYFPGNPIDSQWFQKYNIMENAETKCIIFSQQSHRESMI